MTDCKDEPQTRECHECGGAMVYEWRPEQLTHLGSTLRYARLGWWCEECSGSLFSEGELLKYDDAYRAFREKAEIASRIKSAEEKYGAEEDAEDRVLKEGIQVDVHVRARKP